MPAAALALLLVAAVAHATWNFFAKGVRGSLAFTFAATTLAQVVYLPVAIVAFAVTRPSLGPEVWLFVIVSGALNAVYFVLLIEGYREGDLSLVYEAVDQLTRRGIGQSTCIGVGGDPIIGTTQREALELLNEDPDTAAIVLIGEIGGSAEQEAAEYIRRSVRKPVIAFIAGSTAPPGRRMGHAGAIISGNTGTAAAKKQALADAGVTISDSPAEIGATAERVLRERGLL